MRVDHFDFELPEALIALRPAEPRDASRLLRVEAGKSFQDFHARDLPDLLQAGDVLVFNDTKVIPAQLEGVRDRDGATASVGATLHMRLKDNVWAAFVRGAKKLKVGDHIRFRKAGIEAGPFLDCSVIEKKDAGEIVLEFDRSGDDLDAGLVAVGQVPLPPYIASKRDEDERDRTDYQTIYARENGAVAAPTAGLHFTPDLMQRLQAKGIGIEYLTLHVGAGTFLPVKADDTSEHKMHSEIGVVSPKTADRLNEAKASGGRIVCVGTTSLRLIESAARPDGTIEPWEGATDIFITPGYRFRACDMLMTNFHLPRSTLFMLVSAFAGFQLMKQAYAHAIKEGYRFYSYGDTSLLTLNRDAETEEIQ